MKKIALLVLVLMLVNIYAVDMKGKIGFGIGTTRFGDLLKPSLFAMRFGVSSKMVLEPWFDVSKLSAEVTVPPETIMYWWDTIIYPERQTELSVRNTGVGLEGLYAFRNREKSNLYGIGGLIFGMAELKRVTKYGDDKYTASLPFNYFAIPIGVGGERFLIDNALSVNINVKCGFAKIWGKTKTTTDSIEDVTAKYNLSVFNFGNSLFNIYFMWYF